MVWPGAALDIGDKELVFNVDVVLGLLDGGDQRLLDAELGEILTCRPAGTTSHHLSSGSNQSGLMVGCYCEWMCCDVCVFTTLQTKKQTKKQT